ncbi:carbohydrate ABC transporter permease [Mycobacterium sp. NPDC003449]
MIAPHRSIPAAATHTVVPPRPRGSTRGRREWGVFLAFALPNIAVIVVFGLYPAAYNAVLSFMDWDLIGPTPKFAGLDNYVWIFTSSEFANILRVTAIFTVCVVGTTMTLGLLLAQLLNQRLVGRNMVRTAAFAPHVLSGAAVAMIWAFIFDPGFGLARAAFEVLGAKAPPWLTSSSHALIALIIVYVWKGIGFCAIVYLAALQNLPRDLYEAATIDGAGPLRQFWDLTLPMLSPTTFFLLVVSIIDTTQAFDVIAVLTGGGPGTATTTLSWFIYEEGLQNFNVGRAAAGAMVLFVALLVLTGLQRRFIEAKVHYQ